MKKIIAYIAVLAAFTAVSCTRSEMEFEPMDSTVLTISLNTSEMATRASAIPAVEDVVSQFDWFFYADATGTSAPVYHGHFDVTTGDSGTTLTPAGTATPEKPNTYEATTDGTIKLGFDIQNDFTQLGMAYHVYVLANYPGIDHSNASNLTLQKLLAKSMETNFDEKASGYQAINNFVMDSDSGNSTATYPQLVPLLSAVNDASDNTKATLAVKLRRVAAKFTFTLKISELVPDPQNATVTDESLKTYWRPLSLSTSYNAYMVNAVSYATVAGTAEDADDMAPTLINGNSGMTGGHQISYATSHVKTAKDTHNPPLIWELDPFYTYPVEFDTDSNNAPYLKIALPWENVDASGNLTDKGATVFYYKAYLQDADKNYLTSFDRNTHYVVTVLVDTIGGTQEDYVTLDTYYYMADWQIPADGTYQGYTAPRFLDIARPVYYIYGDNELTVAVTSSHAIEAVVESVSQKTILGTDKPVNKNDAVITNNGKVSFKLFYELDTTLDKTDGDMDLSPITWNMVVYHADDHSYVKRVQIIQYPSIYGEMYHTDLWDSRFVNNERGVRGTGDGTTTNVWNNHGESSSSNDYYSTLGGVRVYSGKSWNKTVLSISTLASFMSSSTVEYDWLLGDPRVRLADSGLYGKDINGTSWARDDLGVEADGYLDDYLVADINKGNYIAPKFMITSGLAADANHTWEHWKNAAERCASYQEDGYPAGRWRLPTEAEIEFVIQLENSEHNYLDPDNVIFHPDHSYWASTGRYYYGKTHEFTTPTNVRPGALSPSVAVSNRCVYDLWYWGDEYYNNENPAELVSRDSGEPAATRWLGFMMTL